MLKNICKGVWQTSGDPLSGGGDAMGYLVEADGLVLIDAGAQPQSGLRILDNLASEKFDMGANGHLILTHGHVDHIGGVSTIKEKTGCNIACHDLDADVIQSGDPVQTAANWYGIELPQIEIDVRLKGSKGAIAGLDWHHTPGHTPGSIVLTFQCPDGLVLFGQDIHGPFSPEFGSNLNQWADSMRRVIALNADILCEGHYGIYRGKSEVSRFIEEHLRDNGFEP